MNDDAPTQVVDPTSSSAAQRRVVRDFVQRAGDSSAVDNTRPLLLARLRLAAGALLTIQTAFFVRNMFVVDEVLRTDVSAVLIALVAAALVVLFRFADLSVGKLRLIELVVFGVPALRIALENYLAILQTARGGNVDGVLAQMYVTTLLFFAITVFYGMFVPNTVRRASFVIGTFGVVFILMLPVMSFHRAGSVAALSGRTWSTFEQRSGDGVCMIIFGGRDLDHGELDHPVRLRSRGHGGAAVSASTDLTERIGAGRHG